MAGSYEITGTQPRVFISYARADGQDFATSLRKRLEAENVPLWQDRVNMEGGRDWWLQIVEALDHVEFMVLIMTPAALQSPIVRKEWHYARQKGVCVYPVKGQLAVNFATLPRWMRDVHWYDLDHEWVKFVNDLHTRCQQKRVPFMVEDLPADYVERPDKFEALMRLILDEQHEELVAMTAAMRGAGGYGKTTLAKALCHDERIQEAFDDGILWVTLGENPSNLIGKIEDLVYILSRVRPGFASIDAATAHFAALLADRDILLVIDDVWNSTHLKPFLQGGKRCTRLITTRDEGVLPRIAQHIQVDAMHLDQAVMLLETGLVSTSLSVDEEKGLIQLAVKLGKWPLLLTLVNSALRERVNRGQMLSEALASIKRTLEKRGLTAFDARDVHERSQAVSKTLDVSFDLLSVHDYRCFRELAIFPVDIDIPLATVQTLWSATGGLDEIDTEEVCERLYKLSLLLRFDLATRTIRLHDVVRMYLQLDVGAARLIWLHTQFLHAYKQTRWAELPSHEPYLWDHLAEHLIGAGWSEELVITVKDGRYLTEKMQVRSVHAVETDLNVAMMHFPTDTSLKVLKRSIARMSHLLNQCSEKNEVRSLLHRGLSPLHELSDVCAILEQDLPRPFLTAWHPLPDLRHTMLLRTQGNRI